MARMVRPARVREGRSLGERSSEILVFIVIIVAIVWAARWYLVVWRNGPTVALMNYVGAVKAGNVELQYSMISADTKKHYPTKRDYQTKWSMAQGLQGRLVDYTIKKIEEKGNTAEAVVDVAIRKEKQEIYQAASDKVTDKYVLVKEPQGWKVALDKSVNTIKTLQFAEQRF